MVKYIARSKYSPETDEAVTRAINNNILELLKVHNRKIGELQVPLRGASLSSISGRLAGNSRWKVYELYQIAAWLGVPLSAVFPPMRVIEGMD